MQRILTLALALSLGLATNDAGASRKGCACSSKKAPVCGANGKTYRSPCHAHCDDVRITYHRRCRPPFVRPCRHCSFAHRPVCGTNHQTYRNACWASCRGIGVAYYGSCTSYCGCSSYYSPVCGTNGVSYRNACVARCGGVGVSYNGRCYVPPIYPIYPRSCPPGCKRTSYGPCQCPVR